MLKSTDQGLPQSRLFRSFWQAGFESATHRNRKRRRVDMIAATQHLEHADADYA
nr:hypothetical protein [Chloroflexia bacterium]